MSVLNILMECVEYPFKDIQKYLTLSILFIIIYFFSTTTVLPQYSIIFAIIATIILIIVFGYFSSVIASTFRGYNKIPQINFIENIVDGFKYLILGLIYSIIPLLILFFLFSAAGNNNPLWVIVNLLTPNTTILGLATGEFIETFLESLINGKFVTTYTIIFLLGIIFSYAFFLSLGRILDSGSILEGFKFKKVYNAYKEIGIENYTKWFILIIIYLIVFAGIWALLSFVPYGDYISYFIIAPFILLFTARAIGLIYMENTQYPNYPQDMDNRRILDEEELRKKALERSAKKYSEEIDRVNQLRKKNYEERQGAKKQKRVKPEKFTSANTEKLENLEPVREIKPIHVEKEETKPVLAVEKEEEIIPPHTQEKIDEVKPLNTEETKEDSEIKSNDSEEKLKNLKPLTEFKSSHSEEKDGTGFKSVSEIKSSDKEKDGTGFKSVSEIKSSDKEKDGTEFKPVREIKPIHIEEEKETETPKTEENKE